MQQVHDGINKLYSDTTLHAWHVNLTCMARSIASIAEAGSMPKEF